MVIKYISIIDIDKVVEIQAENYGLSLNESKQSFACKRKMFLEGALGIFNDNCLIAYVFSFPWNCNRIMPLNSNICSSPKYPNCLYIHDLAVCKSYQNQGLGKILFNELQDIATFNNLRVLSLVAVNSTELYWKKFGFIEVESFCYGNKKAVHMLSQMN